MVLSLQQENMSGHYAKIRRLSSHTKPHPQSSHLLSSNPTIFSSYRRQRRRTLVSVAKNPIFTFEVEGKGKIHYYICSVCEFHRRPYVSGEFSAEAWIDGGG